MGIFGIFLLLYSLGYYIENHRDVNRAVVSWVINNPGSPQVFWQEC